MIKKIKLIIIYFINRGLFNYKRPIYRPFIYSLASRYVDFCRGEHNSNMITNGEYRLLDLVFKKKDIKIVFDVGANVGDYVKHILSYRDTIKVYCFEPDSTTFGKLMKNVSTSKNIYLENIALGETIGNREMYINKDSPELNSFYDMEQENYNIEKKVVKTDTLDEYCKRKNIKHIDLLKVDTEGHELFVFQGAKNLFKDKSIDMVQFEFGNAAIYSRVFFKDIYDFFIQNEYDIYKVKPITLEKVKYCPEYEKIMYANFIAIRKGVAIE